MRAPFYAKGYSKYGAQMGRQSDPPGDFDLSKRLHCRHVPLGGGYDPGGAYWGGGTPLWCVWDDEGHEHYARGSRSDVQKKFPGAKWFRTAR